MSDKTYRNIQEQVLKNAQDIARLKELPEDQIGLQGEQGPQGVQGPVGPQGQRGNKWTVSSAAPLDAINGDCWLDYSGLVKVYINGVWTPTYSLQGPQGIQGNTGPQGEQGIQGPIGPQGPQGEQGEQFVISGPVATVDSLPEPATVALNSAYLVGASAPYALYVVSGGNTWVNVGTFATLDNIQKVIIDAPEGAISGTLTQEQLNLLINNDVVLQLGYDIYHKTEDQEDDGYWVYTSFNNVYISVITVMTAGSWTKTTYRNEMVADNSLSTTSTNPVQNRVVTDKFNSIIYDPVIFKQNAITLTSESGWREIVIVDDIIASPNISYTFEASSLDLNASNSQIIIDFLDNSKTTIGSRIPIDNPTIKATLTSPDGTVYLKARMSVNSGTATYNNFRIYTGDTERKELNPDVSDDLLSTTSTNPVQNKVITEKFDSIVSTNLLFEQNNVVFTATRTGWQETEIAKIPVEEGEDIFLNLNDLVLGGVAGSSYFQMRFCDVENNILKTDVILNSVIKGYRVPTNAVILKLIIAMNAETATDVSTISTVRVTRNSNVTTTDFNNEINVGENNLLLNIENKLISFANHDSRGKSTEIITGVQVNPGSILHFNFNLFVTEGIEAIIWVWIYNIDGTFKETAYLYKKQNTIWFDENAGSFTLGVDVFQDVGLSSNTILSLRVYEKVKNAFNINKRISTNIPYDDYNIPILYLNGNVGSMTKDNEVQLQYSYEGMTGTADVKWQGTSSIGYSKKNLTVKFDNAFEAKDGWGSQRKYCMKANWIDFSHARNVVSAKLWGDVVKSRDIVPTNLRDLINGGAIDGFPCCIVVNGEYWGLYSFNIPKDGWMFGMGSGTREAVICAEGYSPGGAFDQSPVLGQDFDIEYATDEDDVAWIQTALNNIYNALQNATAENFDETVGQYLDIDSVIDYICFIDSIHAIDNINKNYLLATYDGIKWYMSAYDMDSTYGLYWDGTEFVNSQLVNGSTPLGNGHALYAKFRQFKLEEIKARFEQLTTQTDTAPLNKGSVAMRFLDYTSAIPKALLDEEVKLWKNLPSTACSNVNQIINHYDNRQERIIKFIEEL